MYNFLVDFAADAGVGSWFEFVIGIPVFYLFAFFILIGSAFSTVFNKIFGVVISIFGIWWSIGIMSVSDLGQSELNKQLISICSATIFSLSLNNFFAPVLWQNETIETKYYLVLGTLLESTDYNGGFKGFTIGSLIIMIAGIIVGTGAAHGIGILVTGILGIILHIGFIVLHIFISMKEYRDYFQ